MNLNEIALKHDADKSSAGHNYCFIYERYISEMRQSNSQMMEIGVQYGKSALMWLEYFPHTHLWGIDIRNQQRKDIRGHARFHFVEGDQRDGRLMRKISGERNFWFVVDDGCHHADAMSASFAAVWPNLAPGGIYAIEDLHCLWHEFYRSPVNGAQWLGSFLGDLNRHGKTFFGWPGGGPSPEVELTYMERTLEFAHFYKGLVILGKRHHESN